MSNELQILAQPDLIPNLDTTPSFIQQTGEKNVLIKQADTVNMNIKIDTNTITPQLLQQAKPCINKQQINRTHYNLFVTHSIDFSKTVCVIDMDPSKALTENTANDVRLEFSTLTDDAISKIKTFPCIFANKNLAYGSTNEEQVLGLGFVKQVKITKERIGISAEILYTLPQQRINEALLQLDIDGNSSFNELNQTHWSIKKVDLYEKLNELGFPVEL